MPAKTNTNGMHFTIASSVLKFFNISLSYQQLNSDMWNAELEDYKSDTNKLEVGDPVVRLDLNSPDDIRLAELTFSG